MILHSIIIHCSPDERPNESATYTWHAGDPIFNVECAIAKLQEWADQNKPKAPVDVALSNSLPIEINPS